MCRVASNIHSFFQQIFTIEVRSVFGAAGRSYATGWNATKRTGKGNFAALWLRPREENVEIDSAALKVTFW